MYDSRTHIVDLNFLDRSSINGHHNWSTAMQRALENGKYIPRTDNLSVKPAWLFQHTKRKWAVLFWVPDYISHHCTANKQTFSWVMIYDNPNNANNLHKHIHDWQPNCGAALTVLGYREDRDQVVFSAPYSRFSHSTVILQSFSWLLFNSDVKKPINWQKHTDKR